MPSTTTTLFGRGGGKRRGGGRKVQEFVPPMNQEIKQNELRVTVVSKEGKDEPLGVMSKQEALAKAQELGGLDLSSARRIAPHRTPGLSLGGCAGGSIAIDVGSGEYSFETEVCAGGALAVGGREID